MKLNLERIELREIELPLKYRIESSFGRSTRRRIMIVRVFDQSGTFGYGECTAPEDPFFNHETIDTAWLIISQYVAPILASARVESAVEVNEALARIRGNRMAKAGVETAVWDLEARLAGQPLWRYLGGTQSEIASGVSIGLQESNAALLEKVERELAAGYQRIKIKIKPGRDIELVAAIRERYPQIRLSVDANSAYTLADIDLLKRLDEYNLMMIEQPLTPGDLVDHARLQREIKTPICLDESITVLMDARHAIELGSCRIINIKLGRVGGHSEARRIQDYCHHRGIPTWCGGMLESGVGRAHNIAMSTLAGFTLPGDVSASARYWEEDIIEPPVTVSARGTITPPEGPGIGFAVNEARLESLVARRQEIKL
ncbi:MAG: o-succinylbenzoate synthase [Blastocatellia bacterium]